MLSANKDVASLCDEKESIIIPRCVFYRGGCDQMVVPGIAFCLSGPMLPSSALLCALEG